MISYIAIFIGGGIGAVLRYLITFLSNKIFGSEYPYGTFIINIIGCLFLGFIIAVAANKDMLHSNRVLFLTIGIAGGFTTFSTFSYESLTLMRKGQVLDCMSYLFLSPVLGLISVYIGHHLGKFYS